MGKLRAHHYRRTTLTIVGCAALLIGVGLSRLMAFEAVWIIITSVLFAVSAQKRHWPAVLCILLLGLCLGGYKGTISMRQITRYDAVYDQKVTVIGRAADDAAYGKRSQLSFTLRDAYVVGQPSVHLPGLIGVSGFGAHAVYRGDVIKADGKLRAGSGARQAWLSYAMLSLVSHKPTIIDTVRLKFAAGMQSALPEPASAFGLGLLLGQRTGLPDGVKEDLLKVGLVHIIAVSGYNLTIILQASMRIFGKRSKYQTMLFSVTLIAVFLLLTGSSASIVRAALVSLCSLLAWYHGHQFKPLVVLLLTGAITGFINPFYIWGDIGWYLSFLAFFGVLVLAPLVKARTLPERLQENMLVGIAMESICAEAMTLPLVLYIFGQMSLVNLPANVLIAAWVPLAMLLTVVAGLAGMLAAPIAGWIAWPATQLLTYMLDSAHILAGLPHIFLQNIIFSLPGMLAAYTIVVYMCLLLRGWYRRSHATPGGHGIIQQDTGDDLLLKPSYALRL